MIKDRKELKYYIERDLARYNEDPPVLKDLILSNEKWYIHRYLVILRHVEYFINTNKRSIRFLYWWYRYKRLGFKLRITIYPNTTGPGLYIPHVGDMIWIKSSCVIGENLTIRPGVVIGKKKNESAQTMPVYIGDNCNMGLGVRVFGRITIGDNVTIGANSVVTKDIPSNAVAGGVPAKILKSDLGI